MENPCSHASPVSTSIAITLPLVGALVHACAVNPVPTFEIADVVTGDPLEIEAHENPDHRNAVRSGLHLDEHAVLVACARDEVEPGIEAGIAEI